MSRSLKILNMALDDCQANHSKFNKDDQNDQHYSQANQSEKTEGKTIEQNRLELTEALLHDVFIVDQLTLESETTFNSIFSDNNLDLDNLNLQLVQICDTENSKTKTEKTNLEGNTENLLPEKLNPITIEPEITTRCNISESCEYKAKKKTEIIKRRKYNSIVDYTDSEDTDATVEIPKEKEIVEREDEFSYENKENFNEINFGTDSEYSIFASNNNKDESTSGDDESMSSGSSPSHFRGKRPRKRLNKQSVNKKLRLSGKTYCNYKNQKIAEKKVLANPCLGNNCLNDCRKFSEMERQSIFDFFWKLETNIEKKSFLNGCVNVIPIKRKRTQAENSRRNLTYQYFFMKNAVQSKVCLQFILNTLNISQKLVRSAIKGKVEENRDKRGRHEPKHKITPEQIVKFKSFIESLPAVPSHYCRSSTSKLYLPAEIKTISNLYKVYTSSMQIHNSQPIGLTCFKKLFKRDYNIGIHVPRKDKCIRCEKYKNIPDLEKSEKHKQEYLDHQKNKNDAKMLFLSEQNRSTENGFLVTSFDLQKVLSTPHGPSMTFGFSRKYACYNFTVYESKTQNGYCYLWGEREGKRGANEISTNLFSYLNNVDQQGTYQCVSFFCDNCPGQNKNKFLLSMLLYFLNNSKTINEISITYLVAGHTYMPVDSVHAVIEKHISGVNIQAPSEWSTIIRNARKRPRPYEIIKLQFSDFLDWKALAVSKKLKTPEGVEIKVSDIKTLKLSKNDLKNVFISTSYEPQRNFYKVEFPIRKLDVIPRLYNSELPINKLKLKNLFDLCKELSIKKEYHGEYYSLTSSGNVPDVLPETDVEDNIE